MGALLDSHLERIQGNNLSEGVWETIKKFLEFSESKNRLYTDLKDKYEDSKEKCNQYEYAKDMIMLPIGDMVYMQYKLNPEYVTCRMKASYMFWLNVLAMVKKYDKEEICKNNLNKKRCFQWVDEMKKTSSEKLFDIKDAFKNPGSMTEWEFKKLVKNLKTNKSNFI